jgi:hypothetical protein
VVQVVVEMEATVVLVLLEHQTRVLVVAVAVVQHQLAVQVVQA